MVDEFKFEEDEDKADSLRLFSDFEGDRLPLVSLLLVTGGGLPLVLLLAMLLLLLLLMLFLMLAGDADGGGCGDDEDGDEVGLKL